MKKITNEQLNQFCEDAARRDRQLRLGQLFCNTFGITDTVLFYEQDEERAWQMIFKIMETV